jgi:hypothetical protein
MNKRKQYLANKVTGFVRGSGKQHKFNDRQFDSRLNKLIRGLDPMDFEALLNDELDEEPGTTASSKGD